MEDVASCCWAPMHAAILRRTERFFGSLLRGESCLLTAQLVAIIDCRYRYEQASATLLISNDPRWLQELPQGPVCHARRLRMRPGQRVLGSGKHMSAFTLTGGPAGQTVARQESPPSATMSALVRFVTKGSVCRTPMVGGISLTVAPRGMAPLSAVHPQSVHDKQVRWRRVIGSVVKSNCEMSRECVVISVAAV